MALEREFQYYKDHQDELVKHYNGKFIVIRNNEVFGTYNSEIEAYVEAQKHFELGTFLIQLCVPGSESYSQTYTSRVAVKNEL